MALYTCFNSNGATSASAENLLTSLTQWDTNRKVVIRDIPEDITGELYVHFSNPKMSNAYIVQPTLSDDGLYMTATIPNSLMMMPDNIIIYIREYKTSGEQITHETIIIPMIPRPMPSDYLYRGEISDALIADGLILLNDVLYLSEHNRYFGTGVEIS